MTGPPSATSSDYGKAGLVGILTPQANTTVEPELWSLLPAGWSMLNARLTSSKPSIEERLADYIEIYASTAREFANAPIAGIAAACTGASYLIGPERELHLCQQIEAETGLAFITAARAAVSALQELGITKIALLSPYPASLGELSAGYWRAQGFEIVAEAGPSLENESFHPIYALAGNGIYPSYQKLSDSPADLILMLGTGMATLGPILKGRQAGLTPAISCNLALAWALCQAIDPSGNAGLADWMAGDGWSDRLALLHPQAILS